MRAKMMKDKLYLKWSFDNKKLKKTNTVSFNLPAIESCPQAGICATVCYATQGAYVYPNVKNARRFNFEQAKGPRWNFENPLIHDLGLIKQTSIRLHDSGDFFSQAYLNIWFKVITLFPEKQFYAYTKSLHLDFSNKPDNFTLIQSFGGKLDHLIQLDKPHSKIFDNDASRMLADYCDGNVDDSPAQRGELNIGLVYHGTKKLTESQIERFKE
jgi:hypothetical protein